MANLIENCPKIGYLDYSTHFIDAEIQCKSGQKNLQEAAATTKSDETINFNQNLKRYSHAISYI